MEITGNFVVINEFSPPDGRSYEQRPSIEGGLWSGWTSIPGGANATMLDAAVVAPGRIGVVAGWAGGTSLFLVESPASTYMAHAIDLIPPSEVDITPTGPYYVRITTTATATGYRQTRGVPIFPAVIPQPTPYLWTPALAGAGTVTTKWRDFLGVALGLDQFGRVVMRVMDQTFPRP